MSRPQFIIQKSQDKNLKEGLSGCCSTQCFFLALTSKPNKYIGNHRGCCSQLACSLYSVSFLLQLRTIPASKWCCVKWAMSC